MDDEDFEELSKHKWHVKRSKRQAQHYVTRTVKDENGKYNKKRFMHRDIMKPEKGMMVDHIDHNTLNNQKSNLRVCTHSQNQMNRRIEKGKSSRFKGVSKCKKKGMWEACIQANRKQKYLGAFDSELGAAIAYNDAARELFGEFANLNEI